MAKRGRHQYVRDATDDNAEIVSRSQRKRDSAALQAKGEELALLPPARQALLPLPPELVEALAEFRALSGREARRRQSRYIGRLMREAEEEGTLQAVLDAWARLEWGGKVEKMSATPASDCRQYSAVPKIAIRRGLSLLSSPARRFASTSEWRLFRRRGEVLFHSASGAFSTAK